MKKAALQRMFALIFGEVGKRIDARAATLERRINELEVKMQKRLDILETRRAGMSADDPPPTLPGESVDEYAARCAAALMTEDDGVQS